MSAPAPDTVTEAVAVLEADGYTGEFQVEGTDFVCLACGTRHAVTSGIAERIYRFEGPSDPADEAIVVGVRCTVCGTGATLVSSFGPDADPAAFAHLLRAPE